MAEACPRCGHDVVHELPASERLKKLVPGMSPHRVTCGAQTDSWRCPCRSRYHRGEAVGAHHH